MITRTFATGTWASIDEHCPLRCDVEGSDLANVVIGGGDQSVELLLNAAGIRRLAEVSVNAIAEMDALFEQEGVDREAAVG